MSNENAVTVFGDQTSAVVFDASEARVGFEHVTQRDIGIPTLVKLEARSRYLDPKNKDYTPVEGAQEGDLLLTPANVVFKKGAFVVPFGYIRVWSQMRTRASGGGFVANHTELPREAKVIEVQGKKLTVMPNGDEISETAVFGVLINLSSGEWIPSIVRMKGYSLRTARQWINLSMATGRPLYGMGYNLSTVPDSNNQGSFLTYKVDSVGFVTSPELIEDARKQHAGFAQVFAGVTPTVDEAY